MIARFDLRRVAIQLIAYNELKIPEAMNQALIMKGQERVQADEKCVCHSHLHATSL
jgi:hypothetical protein